MPVATKTQSVTNSKLALGTAALLMASGLAFIAIPAANRSGIASSKEIVDKRCVDGISGIMYQCRGSKKIQVVKDGCKQTRKELFKKVEESCGGGNGLITRSPKKQKSSTQVPGSEQEAASTPQEQDVDCLVTFPDQNLHNAVCGLFDMQDNCDLSCDDPRFLSASFVVFDNREIQDITGIERFANIRHLSLQRNEINDISAVSSLGNLVMLKLFDNQISDISSISNLNNLTDLYLANNQISDISGISNLNNLTDLDLGNNQISDISGIANLSSLNHLMLFGNEIDNLSAISGLDNLRTLHLAYIRSMLSFQPLLALGNTLTYIDVSGSTSSHGQENCQTMNSLIAEGVQVVGFDPTLCEESEVQDAPSQNQEVPMRNQDVPAEEPAAQTPASTPNQPVCDPLPSDFACGHDAFGLTRPFSRWDFSSATTTASGVGVRIEQNDQCVVSYEWIPSCGCVATASSTIANHHALFSGAYQDENGVYHSPCIN